MAKEKQRDNPPPAAGPALTKEAERARRAREARLAAALRANLVRRKADLEGRADDASPARRRADEDEGH